MFDDMLTEDGINMLKDRYLAEGQTPHDMLERLVATCESGHRIRMLSYLHKMWFLPATPILSNFGTDRGLPISCYLNTVEDSMVSISKKWDENVQLGSKGGGVGTCWSRLRPVGASVNNRGSTSGVIPFIKVSDSMTMAVSQGSLRRGAGAAYLDVSHPEIEEFLEIRKPSGDFNRKSLNLHHGITITDAFMLAVKDASPWELKDPHTNLVIKTVSARGLWQQILETRMATGEPYMIFTDTVNRTRPNHHKALGLEVEQSNLCSEIVLPTGPDHNGKDRTAVCCLGSVNLEYFDDWKHDPQFIDDCLLYLDLVLSEFILKARDIRQFQSAVYSAQHERSVGLGAMGFHSYLQKNSIPFESASAKSANMKIFKHIGDSAETANARLGKELGSCRDFLDYKEKYPNSGGPTHRRFSYCLAIAPTASISILAGDCSPCIEPWNANFFIRKMLNGTFSVRNKFLKKLLDEIDCNTEEIWQTIIANQGSVQHLDCLSDWQRLVFKTSFEIDPNWVIEFAADRAPHLDQAQSVNLFLAPDVDKYALHQAHFKAWKLGVKSLYYLRSKSLRRASLTVLGETDPLAPREIIGTVHSEEGCSACQ